MSLENKMYKKDEATILILGKQTVKENEIIIYY